jgi:hypothetical protein
MGFGPIDWATVLPLSALAVGALGAVVAVVLHWLGPSVCPECKMLRVEAQDVNCPCRWAWEEKDEE